ncbi:uncharacterized protein LOC126829809 isoform X2 [Patella vulgata]|nr:uncharacterized protein LOC126829809 isoform X2 [Patella vulgata]
MIWIYPSWNNDFGKDRNVLIGFGYAFNRTYKDEFPLCVCYDQMECHHVNREEYSYQYPHILQTDCAIKQIVISEEISDAKAEELSQSGDWIPSTDNVFFDIDEDYYGCQAAVQPLLDVKISEDYIDDSLVPAIMNIFCPRDAKSEQGVDKIYYNLLHRLSDRSSGKKLRTEQRNEIVEHTLQDIKKGNLMSELCNPSTVDHELKGLIETLSILDKQQLKALADLGICLQTTPRAYSFNRMDGMKLCDGNNRPGNGSAVFFYTPTLNEINKRTDQLYVILRTLPEPKFVSLCRSSRDGYVPGQFVSKIETDIIQTLGKVFPNITESSVHYDAELHGGPKGWYNRHPETPW